MENVRVRFAPSPTGTLHIGGARTALFNWLFARSNSGQLILRLEDTDSIRSTAASAEGILEGLSWLGLDWDEGPDIGGPYGPYCQSERLSIYQQFLQQLLDEKKAYYCFCTPDEISKQREEAHQEKKNYLYKRTCKSLSPEQVALRMAEGLKPVIRLNVPRQGTTLVHDLIRGEVEFDNSLLDDFIIAKSDGWPTYNFAVVVDDYTMKISHVIRAEEHLSNTPKQLQVYQALGLTAPQFVHVSMILAPDRSKLSKRHGATSVQEFRDDGYLPDALVNYLALLGWSPGENADILPREQMPNLFSLKDVSLSAAIYDIKKLAWMNGHYITAANIEVIIKLVEDQAKLKGYLTADNNEYFHKVIDLVRSRAKTVNEVLDLAQYFFEEPEAYDEKGVDKYFRKAGSLEKLTAVLDLVSHTTIFTALHLEEATRLKAETLGLKAAELIHPSRLALTGRTMTPGLFEIIELLGRKTSAERISKAVDYINNLA
ncbi:MAG: glutamate--tRNA ligase [Syntrophomonas sp.]|nr:glutamate--tRNA ligase [Syntrophomonas sp.]